MDTPGSCPPFLGVVPGSTVVVDTLWMMDTYGVAQDFTTSNNPGLAYELEDIVATVT
jgi:hypothetical protein